VVAHSDERHANRTASLFEWCDAEHTTTGSSKERSALAGKCV